MISVTTLRGAAHSQRLARLLASAMVLFALAACSRPAPDKPAAAPPEVGVFTLKAGRQTFTTELTGRTSAFLAADIRPQVGGIVQQRLFTEGATVKAGQVLYQLDPATYQATVSSAQATLARSRASTAMAETTAARNAELVRIDAVSRQVNDQSQAALAQARADEATAEAALETARINLGYTRITSPITGRIAASTVTPGALVTANQTAVLTTVQQIDPLYVDVTQSSVEVLRLKREFAAGRLTKSGADAARMRLILEDGTPYGREGRLQFAGISVNPSTGAVTLRGTVPNPDGLLLPGMYVRAVIEEGVDENALLVPQQAITRDAVGRAGALVVDVDGKVVRRAVTLGRALGNRWLVLGGLAAGDRVIVEGSQKARVGEKSRPVEVQVPETPAVAQAAAPAAPVITPAPAR
ncbi:efflux RND transporter periplasmic adaptor subunit [Ramlibacter sp. H39-3-26]|uniref:efflux RND transporter periplasmic adaptor subunit n=1 Tax=Curvibacter soli TaxID=3031331 RepID=UPI0023D99A3F|nr:efflux RND transporter periplasmic adaptor subunit [Ramlibacter sp. H39-3-26]MDF1485144.1 efflux RND transporter periplasmic adaptor subunit [Ramlibacter sp. H39-3-26]